MSFTILYAALAFLALTVTLGFTYKIRGNANELSKIGLNILTAGGGWVPFSVFMIHLFLSRIIHLYEIWPPTDIPVHFSGGLAIAVFVSRCFQLLPRESVKRSRVVLLEILLIGSLTVTAAVFWEFAEFSMDRLLGTNVQLGLANTMRDMAMGILGSLFLILIRIRQLDIGTRELREVTFDFVRGKAA